MRKLFVNPNSYSMSNKNGNDSEPQEKQTIKIRDTNAKSYEELSKENDLLNKKLESIEKQRQLSTDRKIWTGKKIAGFFIGRGLKDSLNNLFNELPNRVTKETLADVTTNVIWRFTRIGLLAVLAVLIPYILLYKQNKLIEYQNKKIDVQTGLLEADRRGALIFLMSNVMDKLDSELKEDWNSDGVRNISPELIGRIAALSYSFKPYRFLSSDTLISKALSPERGQLLLALSNMQIDTICALEILEKCTFKKAYMAGINLNDANLKGVDLRGADLSGAYLIEADLTGASLTGGDFCESQMEGAFLNGAFLNDANLSNANLSNAFLNDAVFGGADLSGVYLSDANLIEAIMGEVNLKNAFMNDANLSNAFLSGASLNGAYLYRADLSGAILEYADLRDADLEDANLERAELDEVYVSNEDWINQLEEWRVGGVKAIKQNYFIVKGEGRVFRLKKKK